MHRALTNELGKGIHAIQLLPERHWDAGGAGQLGMTLDRVVPQGLLKPEYVLVLRGTAKTKAIGEVPFPVAVNRQSHLVPHSPAHGTKSGQVTLHRGTNLDLDASKSVCHGLLRPLYQLGIWNRQPANVSVVGSNLLAYCATEALPQGNLLEFSAQVPQCDVNGRVRQRGNPGASYPLQCRLACNFLPQVLNVIGILTQQQRRDAGVNATGNQLVARQVGMGAGKPVAFHTILCADTCADDPPMRDGVGAVGNLAPRHRDVQDERFNVFDAH